MKEESNSEKCTLDKSHAECRATYVEKKQYNVIQFSHLLF